MAKKIAAVLLILALLVGGAGYWLWTQLTALPDWYDSADMIAEDGSPQVDRDWVRIPNAEPTRESGKGEGAAEATGGEAYQLRNPHLRRKRGGKGKPMKVDKAIRASRVQMSGETIEGGAVLNLSDMDVETLEPKDREAYDRLTEAFPALMGRDVYVGIENATRTEDGEIVVNSKTRLRVGETRYSIASAAKRLGMSSTELRNEIEDELGKIDLPELGGELEL
ncbi:hypothetical protein PPSIR1_11766 [Plesiocystis pacifica SIR-1]|uniref:Uncharacterized protein n=1 Tax=Plesiocystis pacifica SIR-1 TaxID=391625 RepID=A6GHI8_9BACT|nr:hypothetical protein [Plesiocystis pacifica]EDM74661.1 hypothetical protein PPSIR1_11766 [Plesiocystis pacifica SIR-1]